MKWIQKLKNEKLDEDFTNWTFFSAFDMEEYISNRKSMRKW